MKSSLEKKESLPVVVKVKWVDGMRFVANDDKGHSIVMDVSKEYGGRAQGLAPCNSCWLR